MKKTSQNKSIAMLRLCVAALLLVIASLFLFSFTAHKMADDFLKQLGISKINANEKISNSVLGGYLDQYGLSNIKKIATGQRGAVVKSLVQYGKEYVNSAAFAKEYNTLKESRKPAPNQIQTPEELRTQMMEQYKKSIAETEAVIKKSDASMKKVFEDVVVTAKKELKSLEDGSNKNINSYKKNYAQMVKYNESSNAARLQEWQKEFPDNHLLFVKGRLEVFMNETKDIDFDAELVEKKGVKYFVNKTYEYKGDRWKMAFRAGKEAIGTAREMVQQWIDEIK